MLTRIDQVTQASKCVRHGILVAYALLSRVPCLQSGLLTPIGLSSAATHATPVFWAAQSIKPACLGLSMLTVICARHASTASHSCRSCTAAPPHFLLKSGSTLAAVSPAATSARIRLRLYRRTSFLLCSTAAFRALVSLQTTLQTSGALRWNMCHVRGGICVMCLVSLVCSADCHICLPCPSCQTPGSERKCSRFQCALRQV